jgi:hypothetical protein
MAVTATIEQSRRCVVRNTRMHNTDLRQDRMVLARDCVTAGFKKKRRKEKGKKAGRSNADRKDPD